MEKYLKAFSICLLFLALQLATGLFAGGYIALNKMNIGNDGGGNAANHLTIVMILTVILANILCVAVLHKLKLIDWSTIRVNKGMTPKVWAISIVGALGVIFFTNFVGEQCHLNDSLQELLLDMASSWLGVLAIGVLGPICEELVFRTGIMGYLMRNGVSNWIAILFSAFLFGLIHMNAAQIPFAMIMGVVFGMIYVRTGSVVIPIALHILNNMSSALLMHYYGYDIVDKTMADVFGGVYLTATLAFVFGCVGVWLLRLLWVNYNVYSHTK